MYCHQCNKWNEKNNAFCVYCGASLQSAVAENPQTMREILELRRLLDQNRNNLIQISQRLEELEKDAKIPAKPAPELGPVKTEVVLPNAGITPSPVPKSKPDYWEPKQAPSTSSSQSAAAPKQRSGEWEQILGGNWLALIGVFALLMGIAFFLKYAFDKNWTSQGMRVLMVGLFGILWLAIGHLWRKKYPVMTQVLTGGGIGVLYLSVFTAFSLYNLIPFGLTVMLVFGVSALSVFFALRYNSMALAILGVIGAYLAPLLVGISGNNINQGLIIPIYLIIVDVAVLYISTLRNWRWFTLLAFLSSVLIFQITIGKYGGDIGVAAEEAFLTVLFLIFVGATMLFIGLRRKTANSIDYGLMTLNAAYYFAASYGIMWSSQRSWMGLFSLIVALFYGGLFYLIRKRGKENSVLSYFSLGIALTFLTITIPVQIGDRALTTIFWAAEAVVLLWLSFKTRLIILRISSYFAFTLTLIRLLAFDSNINTNGALPVFNQRGLAFLVNIGLIYFAIYLLRKYKESLSQTEQKTYFVYPFFLIAANLLTLWFIGAEVISNTSLNYTSVSNWPMLFLPIIAALTTLQYVFWRKRTETLDVALLIIDAAFYAVFGGLASGHYRAWAGSLFFFLSLVYFGLVYTAQQRKEKDSQFAILSSIVGVLLFTLAVPVQFSTDSWRFIGWAVEFITLMWLAGTIQMPRLRYFAYGVFTLLSANLLITGMNLDINRFQPVFNLRFLAFSAVITAAYAGFFLLRRDRNIIKEWKTPASTFAISANVLTLLLLSLEIWNWFDKQALNGMESSVAQNAQNLSLTALWVIYAVILIVVGIARRSRGVRQGGLLLIAVSIIKVFVYDVFKLETIYRIIAFVGLGVLLLVGGYLYQRYSKRIKEFITK